MYNLANILIVRKITQDNRLKDQQDHRNVEDKKAMRLFEKADQPYLRFKDLSLAQCHAN